MNDTKPQVSLVVLAAGMGSRYGGLKQMDEFGPGGETLIEYSLYDAIQAGFNHIVFVIRDYFAESFRNVFQARLGDRVKVDFVCQELSNLPAGFTAAPDREKPWGTGHAVWAAREVVKNPFGVINADDYYGVESYRTLHSFLSHPATPEMYALVGYKLAHTLSENGTVNRGICTADPEGNLISIEECKQIARTASGEIEYPGKDGKPVRLLPDTPVSMNMWGFFPSYFTYFEKEFISFLKQEGEDLKSEYYIPTLIDKLIRDKIRQTRILSCDAEWFGVTYREDKPFVSQRLNELIREGVYPENLWKSE